MIDKVALVHIRDGRLLSTRSHGRSLYYVPGGKREPGETDEQTLVLEIREELAVELDQASLGFFGEYTAQADAHPAGVMVRLRCWLGDFAGEPVASSEIAEVGWLRGDEDDQVSPVDRLLLADLRARGALQPDDPTP